MRPSEGVAVVQQIAVIGQVEPGQPDVPVFPKRFPQRQVEGFMRGQMLRPFAVNDGDEVTVVPAIAGG